MLLLNLILLIDVTFSTPTRDHSLTGVLSVNAGLRQLCDEPVRCRSSERGRSPCPMETIVMISFGSVLCAMTALSFIELRRIRKKLESN
jgi:hypothetical protein